MYYDYGINGRLFLIIFITVGIILIIFPFNYNIVSQRLSRYSFVFFLFMPAATVTRLNVNHVLHYLFIQERILNKAM